MAKYSGIADMLGSEAKLYEKPYSEETAIKCEEFEPIKEYAPLFHAKWSREYGIPTCSRCKKRPPRESIIDRGLETPYCPNCGARMDG